MKSPRFSLAEAVGWFLSDREPELEQTTIKRYRGNLKQFMAWLPETERALSSLEPGRVERWLRTSKVHHTRMNRIIAMRSFSRYLAEKKLWYEGDERLRISVLRDIKVPQPLPKGTPAYRDEEVRTIMQNLPENGTSLRTRAIVAVELHGFRAKEVRSMLLRNVVLPRKGEVMGHFVIDSRRQTKTSDGVRIVPMEPVAKDAIVRYIRLERPTFTGDGEETLFLTAQGKPICENSWNSLVRRLRTELKAEVGIHFRQHRFRSFRTAQLHAEGTPDSQIIEVMGWEPENGLRMLRRYAGRVPLTTLKRIPIMLDRVLGASA
ncbi:MAG: tyrosine-type recombinase/integrase [Gemmatimonadaceae bacterium]|nr:tyrosine-type recombinase/integrase [Gemmatimonadaceae bacterium]